MAEQRVFGVYEITAPRTLRGLPEKVCEYFFYAGFLSTQHKVLTAL